MKVAILAGGAGSRLGALTRDLPKPLVEIGGMPILWHVMKHFDEYGLREFVLALGYRGDVVKRWLLDYALTRGSVTFDLAEGSIARHPAGSEEWIVHAVETGRGTDTGGRVGRLREWVGSNTFMLTWCDGVSDVDLGALLAFHRRHGRLATMTAVRQPSAFGRVAIQDAEVTQFTEKPAVDDEWINGAFFVLEPGIFDYIDADGNSWERDCLPALVRDGQLMAYRHTGFWQCMDTAVHKASLEEMWATGQAPWTSEGTK
ncbi:glucose-1-phosphate cytidylyltransferase [Streptomyces sp. NPDC058701]|uniref:glucose-1-phosphate cytidylyltransferase n=1 Tax=Streptomyces sp. NPDC058701 TaxID=3346608 RepID=UPI003663BEB3